MKILDVYNDGIEVGELRGIKKGELIGIEKGIEKQIKTLLKFNALEQDIINTLIEDYTLTKEKAKEYLDKYLENLNK